MPFSFALSSARTELTYIAGIDGKTGSNARHETARLNAVLNRKYRALLSRAAGLGYPHFTTAGSATALPGRTSGEDYQEVSIPADANEVIGVDVRVSAGGTQTWRKLDPITFEQRRADGSLEPPNGVGFWSLLTSPVPSTTSVTAGKIAIWPHDLTGSYKVQYVQGWADITTDTHVFVLYEGWDDWLLNAAALVVCGRDKKDQYTAIERDFQRADQALEQNAPRFMRAGAAVPTPYRGARL